MIRAILLSVLFIFSDMVYGSVLNNIPEYHKVSAESGDGVYSILRRYQLLDANCNIGHFYELNNLDKNSSLVKGKKYQIPVLIFQYNGQSIRSTIDNEDWDKAVRIQKYNEMLLAKGLRKTSYRESKILWVPYNEMHCTGGTNPTVAVKNPIAKPTKKKETVFIDPLFGKAQEKFTLVSNDQKNKVFYIVSGHGGPDPGAIGSCRGHSLCEDEYAYDVALRLAKKLKENGAKVHVIIQDKNDGIRSEDILLCDKDETCMGKSKIPLNQKKRLAQRVYAVNSLYKDYKNKGFKDQYFISIHIDSRSENKRQDVFFYHSPLSKSGKKLALNIQDTFKAKYQKYRKSREYSGSVSSRNLYVLRNTHPTAVFVELANIRNVNDQKRILPQSNRQYLADWLYEGLTK